MKSNCDFFVGRMVKLESKKIEISGSENLSFYVCGVDNNHHECSLEFNSKISRLELMKLNINEKVIFDSYTYIYDVIFGYDGVYSPGLDFNMIITKYLPDQFILVINFYDEDFIGKVELDFKL